MSGEHLNVAFDWCWYGIRTSPHLFFLLCGSHTIRVMVLTSLQDRFAELETYYPRLLGKEFWRWLTAQSSISVKKLWLQTSYLCTSLQQVIHCFVYCFWNSIAQFHNWSLRSLKYQNRQHLDITQTRRAICCFWTRAMCIVYVVYRRYMFVVTLAIDLHALNRSCGFWTNRACWSHLSWNALHVLNFRSSTQAALWTIINATPINRVKMATFTFQNVLISGRGKQDYKHVCRTHFHVAKNCNRTSRWTMESGGEELTPGECENLCSP